jgi:hypothetical protein
VGVELPTSSPGQHAKHYAPISPAYRFDRTEANAVAHWIEAGIGRASTNLERSSEISSRERDPTTGVNLSSLANTPSIALLSIADVPAALSAVNFVYQGVLSADPARAARKLYSVLRSIDAKRPDAILVELPPDVPEWTAVRDRLIRATVDFDA